MHGAAATVPGAGHAGLIGVDRHGRITTEAGTDDLTRTAGHLHHHIRGPSLDTIEQHRTGQDKGILMERHKITAEQAFSLLLHHSQTSNRKLHDLAADVTATGQFPPACPFPSDPPH